MIRLGVLAYINTLPVMLALLRRPASGLAFRLVEGSPAELNRAMAMDRLDGPLDVSPVSSAFYWRNRHRLTLVPDLSISSPGPVNSVLFVSKYPWGPDLAQYPRIPVTDHSETSVALLAHLLQAATGEDLAGRFVPYPANDYPQALAESGCALVIGDNALRLQQEGLPDGYEVVDLAHQWRAAEGLPFVFAVWVAKTRWTEANPEAFEAVGQALRQSRDAFFQSPTWMAEGVRMAAQRCRITPEDARAYWTECLTYDMSALHVEALQRFGHLLEAQARRDEMKRNGMTCP